MLIIIHLQFMDSERRLHECGCVCGCMCVSVRKRENLYKVSGKQSGEEEKEGKAL